MNNLGGMLMQTPTKREIIRFLKNSIADYTELDSNGLETTNVETQILRFAILYLTIYEDIEKTDLYIILRNFLSTHTLEDLSSVLQKVFDDLILKAINEVKSDE